MRNSTVMIPLVGNKYHNRKPNKNDTDIILVKEDQNIHDKNAIGIYSRKCDNCNIKLDKLGYVIKDKTEFIRANYDNIVIKTIVRSVDKNSDGTYYYYLLVSIS